jgi:hypothetical protein
VSKSRPGLRLPAQKAEATAPVQPGLLAGWVRFWFTPCDPVGLHVLRVLAGLLFLWFSLPLAGHVGPLFGLDGWFDRQAFRDTAALLNRQAVEDNAPLPDNPTQSFAWSILYLCGSNATALAVVYWVSVAVLLLFTAGLWTRVTAILSWIVIASFTASPALGSEADNLLLILAFYLMIGYVLLGISARDQSWAARLLGSRDTLFFGRRSAGSERKSLGANLPLRLLQVHFALVILLSGLHKLQFGEWWAGLALWYPLHPPLQMAPGAAGSPAQIRTSLMVLGVAAYAVLAWQIAFPSFAWRPRWRAVLLGGGLIGWLGSALLYHLPAYGPAFFVCCLSYVSAEEWYWVRGLARRIPGLERIASPIRPAPEPLVPQATK